MDPVKEKAKFLIRTGQVRDQLIGNVASGQGFSEKVVDQLMAWLEKASKEDP